MAYLPIIINLFVSTSLDWTLYQNYIPLTTVAIGIMYWWLLNINALKSRMYFGFQRWRRLWNLIAFINCLISPPKLFCNLFHFIWEETITTLKITTIKGQGVYYRDWVLCKERVLKLTLFTFKISYIFYVVVVWSEWWGEVAIVFIAEIILPVIIG